MEPGLAAAQCPSGSIVQDSLVLHAVPGFSARAAQLCREPHVASGPATYSPGVH